MQHRQYCPTRLLHVGGTLSNNIRLVAMKLNGTIQTPKYCA
jgi:hypothetical protein